MTYSKSSKRERGLAQNPARQREDVLKIQQERENDLLKIQQDRENDLLKIQQERERARERESESWECVRACETYNTRFAGEETVLKDTYTCELDLIDSVCVCVCIYIRACVKARLEERRRARERERWRT